MMVHLIADALIMSFHCGLDLASNAATGFCCLFVLMLVEMLYKLGLTLQRISDRISVPCLVSHSESSLHIS